MNKIKFALVSLALVLGFTACNKNDYDYEPGKATASDKALFFDDEENLVLELTDNEVEVTLNRANTEGELTVPLIVMSAPDFVKVPETATFAAGEAQTTVKLEMGEGMEPFVKYLVKIVFPRSTPSLMLRMPVLLFIALLFLRKTGHQLLTVCLLLLLP